MIGNLICETITGFDWDELSEQLGVDFGINEPKLVETDPVDSVSSTTESSSASFFNQFVDNINSGESENSSAGGIGGLMNSDIFAHAQEMFSNGSFESMMEGGSFSDMFEGGEGLQDLLSNGSFFS